MVLPCLKSMTWVMENKNLAPANRVAVINLKVCNASLYISFTQQFYPDYLIATILFCTCFNLLIKQSNDYAGDSKEVGH